ALGRWVRARRARRRRGVHRGGHAPRLPPQPALDAALLDLVRPDVPGVAAPRARRAVPLPRGAVRAGVPRRAIARAVQGPRTDLRADRAVLETRRRRVPRPVPAVRVDASDADGGELPAAHAAVGGAAVPGG